MRSVRLGIVATHPVQYHAHWYRALASQQDLATEVLYCHNATQKEQAEAGFGVEFNWDIPLLEGYPYRFLRNVADAPSTQTFNGLDTPELKNAVKAYDAVLVSGWHYKSAWQAIYSCWRSRIPVLVRGDSHLSTQRSLIKRTVKKPIYRAAISRFNACLAVGKWSREYFLHYGARPERVFHVPHCVDSHLFGGALQYSESLRKEWRLRWDIPEDCCVFLFSGKFIPQKRPTDFVNGISLAGRRSTNIVGVMVGDGPLRGTCEKIARKQNNARLLFTGFLNQTEIRSAYAGCDVLVLPSDGRETWGLVVNEAMLSGRPCIVSDKVGAGPDLIQPGVTGEIYTLGNECELALLMEKYADNLGRTRSMELSVRQQLSRYSLKAAIEGTKEALNAVLCSRFC